jgi:hypothetical protein
MERLNSFFSPIEHYDYFALHQTGGRALLPESQSLVLDLMHEMALLIDWRQQRILASCLLVEEEQRLLLPLLRAWPCSVSYAQLLAILSKESEQECTRRIEKALEAGRLSDLLAPMKEQLQPCQQRIGRFGVRIVAQFETGLVLFANPPLKRAKHRRNG